MPWWDDDNGQSASLSIGGLAYPPDSDYVEASATIVTLRSLYAWRGRFAIKTEITYNRETREMTLCRASWMKPAEVPIWDIPDGLMPLNGLPENATLSAIVPALVDTREILMADAALIFDLSTFG